MFATDRYLLHAACTSSWSSRSSFACPLSRNELFIAACAFCDTSASDITVAQPTASSPASEARPVIVTIFRFMAGSPLDGGGTERAAVRVTGEEHRQRDRRIGGELEFGEALLAKAVVQAPL